MRSLSSRRSSRRRGRARLAAERQGVDKAGRLDVATLLNVRQRLRPGTSSPAAPWCSPPSGSVTFAVITPAGAKPSGRVCRCTRLLISRPAPISRIIASETSATTSAPRTRRRFGAAGAARRAGLQGGVQIGRRGAPRRREPEKQPGADRNRRDEGHHRPVHGDGIQPRDGLGQRAAEDRENPGRERRGRPARRRSRAAGSRSAAAGRRRGVPAPRIVRMAISRGRVAACASSRLATFAQAMSSTRPTAARKIVSDVRTSPTRYSCSGTRSTS